MCPKSDIIVHIYLTVQELWKWIWSGAKQKGWLEFTICPAYSSNLSIPERVASPPT